MIWTVTLENWQEAIQYLQYSIHIKIALTLL